MKVCSPFRRPQKTLGFRQDLNKIFSLCVIHHYLLREEHQCLKTSLWGNSNLENFYNTEFLHGRFLLSLRHIEFHYQVVKSYIILKLLKEIDTRDIDITGTLTLHYYLLYDTIRVVFTLSLLTEPLQIKIHLFPMRQRWSE